jgi:hypothetical protein
MHLLLLGRRMMMIITTVCTMLTEVQLEMQTLAVYSIT